jgi:hypothetical protein
MAAADKAARKISNLAHSWHVMWAGDFNFATRIIADVRRRFLLTSKAVALEKIKEAVCEAYRAFTNEQIVAIYLARNGYKTIEEFRRTGLSDFGPASFKEKLGSGLINTTTR